MFILLNKVRHYKVGGHKRVRVKKVAFLGFILVLALILIFALLKTDILNRHTTKLTKRVSTSSSPAKPSPSSVEGSYLFSGTIVLARDVEKYANGNYNQPFSGMSTLGTYDAHIGDFECPITNNYDSYENEINNLIFNCKPAWLPTLKKYFPILNLSSDHLNDQGPQGIADTFQYLQAAGFQVVGTYNPASLPDDCKAVILPVHLVYPNQASSSASLPIAMCSYNYKELFQPQPGQLQSIQKWSKVLPVIALLNEGPEYQHTASAQAVAIAHQMIDYGADFVVGNGTHWVQNTEVYKGKLIVYSMGNFIFDQIDYDGRIALNLSVGLSATYNQNIARWLGLSSSCAAKPDNCLSLASNDKLVNYNPDFTFNIVGSYGGDGSVASKANAQQFSDIENLANWQSTQKILDSNK